MLRGRIGSRTHKLQVDEFPPRDLQHLPWHYKKVWYAGQCSNEPEALAQFAQVVPVMAALVGSGEGAAQLARFNVSKDAFYSTRARQKGTGLPSKHALPALVLATLAARLPGRELMHRPVSTFIPAPAAQMQAKALKIKLGGRDLLAMACSEWTIMRSTVQRCMRGPPLSAHADFSKLLSPDA